MSTEPLEGLKVLDLSRVLAGPWAAQVLGDLGADVIKIERPGAGDDTRSWGPPWVEEMEATAAYYLAANRNKRSLAVDMAHPEGAELIREIAKHCDILVENFKVGSLARYGLDYESLRAVNPRLIYCSITGFGQDGPYAKRGGYDFLVQGMGGLMSMTGPLDGEPTKVGVPVVDLLTGLYAVIGIQAALRHRDATGQGQWVDCALLDTSVAILANQGMNHLVGGVIPRPMGNGHPNVVPYRTFPTRDGHIIIAVGNDGQFRLLCGVLGCPELGRDPDFATNAARVTNRDRLEARLREITTTRDSAGLLSAMEAAGVPCGPINRLPEVFADPQVQARGMVVEMERTGHAPMKLTRLPIRLSESPASIRRLPPALGADGDELLSELNISERRRADLIARGIVSVPEPTKARTK